MRYKVHFKEWIKNGIRRDIDLASDTIINKHCTVREVEQIAVCGNIEEIVTYYNLKEPDIICYSIKAI